MGFWSKFKGDFKEANARANADRKALLNGTAEKFDYLGGHPDFSTGEVLIMKGNVPNTLVIRNPLRNIEREIAVTKLEWDEQGKRSAGKAVAGAVIGGLLTGGIGLLVGGAIGGRKKDNSLAVMTYSNGVIENTVYIRADNKVYQKLAKLLS